MGFELRYYPEGASGLVAACDVCGRTLTKQDGMLLYSMADHPQVGGHQEYRLACKKDCQFVIEKTHGHQLWQDIDQAIGYLMNAAEVDATEVKKRIAWLAQIG